MKRLLVALLIALSTLAVGTVTARADQSATVTAACGAWQEMVVANMPFTSEQDCLDHIAAGGAIASPGTVALQPVTLYPSWQTYLGVELGGVDPTLALTGTLTLPTDTALVSSGTYTFTGPDVVGFGQSGTWAVQLQPTDVHFMSKSFSEATYTSLKEAFDQGMVDVVGNITLVPSDGSSSITFSMELTVNKDGMGLTVANAGLAAKFWSGPFDDTFAFAC
jgi:hypothetical protein